MKFSAPIATNPEVRAKLPRGAAKIQIELVLAEDCTAGRLARRPRGTAGHLARRPAFFFFVTGKFLR